MVIILVWLLLGAISKLNWKLSNLVRLASYICFMIKLPLLSSIFDIPFNSSENIRSVPWSRQIHNPLQLVIKASISQTTPLLIWPHQAKSLWIRQNWGPLFYFSQSTFNRCWCIPLLFLFHTIDRRTMINLTTIYLKVVPYLKVCESLNRK